MTLTGSAPPAAAAPAPTPGSRAPRLLPCASRRSRLRRWAAVGALSGLLAACGGGGGGETAVSPVGSAPPPPPAAAPAPAPAPTEVAPTRAQAARFLTQATFGPTETDIDRVMALGYAGWIDEQWRHPASSHRATWEAEDARVRALNPNNRAGQDAVLQGFWRHALTGEDQLRQRVAYALSQIFVISMVDGNVGNQPRAVAAWMDTLATTGLGNYRDLLETVARHPLMGAYLSHLRNYRADARTGRVPDENFAREVMQLFSIGLHELNADGTPRLQGGQPVDTYGPDDIAGLAQVFTGWSWSCPDWPRDSCFQWGSAENTSDPDRWFKPMLGYPQFHSPEEKRFLGAVVPAQDLPDPMASLTVAIDTLYQHPNVGPFIGRQLIQRLVSSNPSPAYVADVARAFNDNGAGVRGDMRAVLRTVLLHPEARSETANGGKLREPVLRLSALLRALDYRSDTGHWRVGSTDNQASSLGQTPLRSPSVFNFYRPGYVAPGTASAAAGLVAPELQTQHETTVAGYVNFLRDAMERGFGQHNGTVGGTTFNRRDLQADFAAEQALADDAEALVTRLADRLLQGRASAALRAEIAEAVAAIAIPAVNSSQTNLNQIDNARRNRVRAAVLLLAVSPDFLVQR